VDLRPLYQRFRALSLANAPHFPRHRLGLRAARALPGVRERCGSNTDALAPAAVAAGEPNTDRDTIPVSGDEPSGVAFSESVGVPVRVCLAERFARFTQCLAFGIPRTLGVSDARSDALTGGARDRAGA
jgi:hypothetical protein